MKKEEIENFSNLIETLVVDKNLSYLDAIIYYCEKNLLEVEVAAKLLSNPIKQKLKKEAESLNFLEKDKSRLPI